MRGRALVVILFGTGCASTLALQPAVTAPAGIRSVMPLVTTDHALSSPTGNVSSSVPGIAVVMGLDDHTDASLRLSAGLGLGGTLRRMLTDRDAPGPSLLFELGGTAANVPDFGWFNVNTGFKLGIPLGPDAVARSSHLMLGARVNVNAMSVNCDPSEGRPCAGAIVAPSVSLGLALRLAPSAWLVPEVSFLGSWPSVPGTPWSSLQGPNWGWSRGLVEAGVAVLIPWSM